MPVLPADAAAFIFDCDGTLVDSMDAWLSVWPDVAAEFGVPAVAADFDAYEHLSVEQECIEIHRDFGLRGSAEAFEARIRQEMAERYRTRVRALSGVRAFLGQAAAAGIPMAVATSTSADLVVPCLEQNGIAAYFGAVVTTGMVALPRPSPSCTIARASSWPQVSLGGTAGCLRTHCSVFRQRVARVITLSASPIRIARTGLGAHGHCLRCLSRVMPSCR